MKKILLSSGTNTIVGNLYSFLEDLYKIQLCEATIGSLVRMKKIVRPDIIVVVKTSDVVDSFIKEIINEVSDIPVIVLCKREDEAFTKYSARNLSYVFKPVNNEALIDKIEELTETDVNKTDVSGNEIEEASAIDKREASLVENENKLALEIENQEKAEVQARTELQEKVKEQEDKLDNSVARVSNSAKKRILAIDDNPVVLRNIKQILEEEYEVFVATSVVSAVKLIERFDFDLILLDYIMPDTDGYTAIQILKTNLKTMDWPIIFLTGVSDAKRISDVVALKPAAYLLKPIDEELLLDTIRKVLKKD